MISAVVARSRAALRTLTKLGHAPTHRFQIMSDLHLEINQQYPTFEFPNTAPFLVLAGDIGRLIDREGYLAFLERQAARYERVFLVLGNHEFYGLAYDEGIASARELVAHESLGGRVLLLHRGRYDIPLGDGSQGVVVLGCTLWSALDKQHAKAISSVVSDFKKIRDWTVDDHLNAHALDLAWLRAQVAQQIPNEQPSTPKSILVITHHAPVASGTSNPERPSSPLNSAFATNICNEGGWDGVKGWVFGHTHWTTSFRCSGINVVANQRGYVLPGEVRPGTSKLPAKHQFDATKTILV